MDLATLLVGVATFISGYILGVVTGVYYMKRYVENYIKENLSNLENLKKLLEGFRRH